MLIGSICKNYKGRKMNINDLQKYYEFLHKKLMSGESGSVLNSDRAHNAVIERFMLDTSNNIKMYCGEMSVFREGFYRHIDQSVMDFMGDGQETLGSILKQQLCESLRGFINNSNSKLSIFLERYQDSYAEDLIAPEIFRDGISCGKICIYRFKNDIFLKNKVAHTSCSDKNFIRVERNPETHEAICTINASTDDLNNVNNMFTSMYSHVQEVKLFA